MAEVLSRATQEEQFLETIFGDILEFDNSLRLLIWTKPGQHKSSDSLFFDNTKAAGDFCRKQRESRDVYFGLGLRPDDLSDGRRGGEREVRGIPGFCMDFDVAGEGSTKANVFQDRREVEELLDSLRNKPTLTVVSGHGIHAYWLFSEVWLFESNYDWDSARRMALGWHRHVKSQSERTIDSTFTLDRVWRPAGTYNHKSQPPTLVEVLAHDDFRRYEPDDDFGMFAATSEQVEMQGGMGSRVEVTVDRNAPVPDVVKSLLADSEDFARVWHQIRKMPSQSEYDLAIANVGREHGWSLDETLAAIVSNRRAKSGNMKYGNDGYYTLTLTKVFGSEVESKEVKIAPKPIEAFNRVVGLPIVEVYRYGNLGAGQKAVTFYVKLKGGEEIRIGTIVDFRKQTIWRDLRALYNPDGKYVPTKKAAFDNLVDQVMPMAKDRTMADEKSDAGFLGLLDAYFVDCGGTDLSGKLDKDKSSFTRRGEPFRADGRLWFTRKNFVKWARDEGADIAQSDLTHKLRRAGIERKNIFFEQEGTGASSSKSYYSIRRDRLNEQLNRLLQESEND